MRLRRRMRRSSEEPVREASVDAETIEAFHQFKAGIQGRKGETAVADVLAANGLEALHDIILPDDAGLTQIDHLVRVPDGLIVLETKNFAGVIDGDSWEPQWCQLLRDGQVRVPFQNPLRQNFRHRQAVVRLLEQDGLSVPTRSYVVSVGRARFVPELELVVIGLTRLAQLCSKAKEVAAIDPRRLSEAWHLLERTATAHECRREEHRVSLNSRRS